MDPITKRSATLATAIHACLVAMAFAPQGCSEIPTPTTPPPPSVEARLTPPDATAQKQYGALVAAPVPAPTPDAPLPPLSADDLPPLPDAARLITAVRQDHAASETSRGQQGEAGSAVDLPALPPSGDDLIARLQRAKVSNESLTRESRMLATAQEFLHGRLQGQIDRRWRHLLKEVTETRLVIEIRVDQRGRLTYAHLVNSSGSLGLDRLIGEWLQSPDVNLPPITPDIVYPFLIVIRR